MKLCMRQSNLAIETPTIRSKFNCFSIPDLELQMEIGEKMKGKR